MQDKNTIRDLLWNDTEIFYSSYKKSAHALIAIQESLHTHALPGNQQTEFLQQYQFLTEAEPHHFSLVWSSPFAQQWIKLAYRLCQACFADVPLDPKSYQKYNLDPLNALCRHLHEFAHIVLAVAFLEKQPYKLTNALTVKTPFILPGTDFSFNEPGVLNITGIDTIGLQYSEHGELQKTLPFTQTSKCPHVISGDAKFLLHAGTFNNFPSLDFAEAVVNKPIDYNAECLTVVSKTLELLQQYAPDILQQFQQLIRFVGLKSMQDSNYSNISHSELPGCFIASMNWNAYILADIFIHEFSHNRLFFIETAKGQIFDNDANAITQCRYYSPWREDLRPLYGVFHAVYVYVPVYSYWQAVYADDSIAPELRKYVANEIVKIAMQLKIGVYQLSKYAQFTDFGARLFRQLKQQVDLIVENTEQSFSADLQAYSFTDIGDYVAITNKDNGDFLSVKAVIAKHIQRFANQLQASELIQYMNLVTAV